MLGSCFRTLADILVSDFFLMFFFSKYKAHKLHQRYMVHAQKIMPPSGTYSLHSGPLGNTGVYRQKTEPIVIQDFQSPSISKLAQHVNSHKDRSNFHSSPDIAL